MQISTQNQTKSSLLLTIEISPDEYQPFLEKTAIKISNNTKIQGFRPGSAPYEIIKQKLGEAEILNQALPDILNHTFIQAIQQKKINALGQPEINVIKIAPGNNLVYTAELMLMPKVKLADLNSISLRSPRIKIDDKEINHTLEHLAKSRAAQKLVSHPATKKDLVKLDYSISIDNVPQEGGQQIDFEVYLGDSHMVPGFEQQIIGLSAGQTKKFDIKFPNDYFQKNFAGKICSFNVKIKAVYELTIPPIDDEFAKSIAKLNSLAELKELLKQNILQEKTTEQNKKMEIEILDKIIGQSEFDELPSKMIDNEVQVMLGELENDLASHGLKLEVWLRNMKKELKQFKQDLRPQAIRRIKSALIIKNIAQQQKIKVAEKEIETQINKLIDSYKNSPDILKKIKSPAYKNNLANVLIGQKTIEWLKQKIIKQK